MALPIIAPWIINISRQFLFWLVKKYGKQVLKKIAFSLFRKWLRVFIRENKKTLEKEYGKDAYNKMTREDQDIINEIWGFVKENKSTSEKTSVPEMSLEKGLKSPTTSTKIKQRGIEGHKIPDYQVGSRFGSTIRKGILWP